MLELMLYGLLAIAVAVGLFLLAARFLPAGEQIAPPLRDEAPWQLPGGRTLTPHDVDAVRLPVALRGYRFAETDVLLDRLAGELRERDEEIARLRGHAGMSGAAPEHPVDPPGDEHYAPPAAPAAAPPADPAAPSADPATIDPDEAPVEPTEND